jgi:rhodanese-related sulfurtransferase
LSNNQNTFSAHSSNKVPGPASPHRASNSMRLAVLAARLIMAGIFIYASIDKIAHPAAFAKDIYNYQILPDVLINLTALVLPWMELFLGLCLLTGIWLPGTVLTVNGLLVVFLAAFVFNLARGLNVDCGCFGAGGLGSSMSTGGYLLRDMAFLALGVFLFYSVFRNQLQRRLKSPSDKNRDGESDGKQVRAASTSMVEHSHLSIGSKTGWSRAALQILALVALSAVAAPAVNALRTDRLPLVGDWSVAGRITTATGERMDISLFEAQKLFANDAAVFIDARPAEDYSRGHIQGARSLPRQELDLKFIDVTKDLDLQTPIITYCDGETCELSHDLALFLRDAGFVNTRVLVNGWSLWRLAGLPVETGMSSANRQ